MTRIVAASALLCLSVLSRAAYANQLNACTVLSADEIKSALGRKDLGAATPGRASGGASDCRFPGSGNGDVRITLAAPSSGAKADFDLKPQIYADEGKKFEKVAGIGDGAYYWDDTIEFRVGDRVVSIWINRTPRSESPSVVKPALTSLARRTVDRLRGNAK
jgi:hypothetical protein